MKKASQNSKLSAIFTNYSAAGNSLWEETLKLCPVEWKKWSEGQCLCRTIKMPTTFTNPVSITGMLIVWGGISMWEQPRKERYKLGKRNSNSFSMAIRLATLESWSRQAGQSVTSFYTKKHDGVLLCTQCTISMSDHHQFVEGRDKPTSVQWVMTQAGWPYLSAVFLGSRVSIRSLCTTVLVIKRTSDAQRNLDKPYDSFEPGSKTWTPSDFCQFTSSERTLEKNVFSQWKCQAKACKCRESIFW